LEGVLTHSEQQVGETSTYPAPPLSGAVASGRVSLAIVRVARLHRVLAGQLLRKIGLHPAQELVMMYLWDCGPQRQTDLARLLDADAATMTRTIQRLEQGGFVRRIQSEADKRVTIVEATTASRALREEVERAWAELERSVTQDLTAEEQSAALDLLGRMEASLSEIVASGR
jgi:DNA-binding MarR family transcriptional regulator